jgi:hypothetical protein
MDILIILGIVIACTILLIFWSRYIYNRGFKSGANKILGEWKRWLKEERGYDSDEL